jgi:transcriptional regulator with XRE-family HTH domain
MKLKSRSKLLKPKSRLAALRKQAGLTQVQVAALVGVTPNTIQNWEKDNGLYQLEPYLKLAEFFDCEVSDLVEYVPMAEGEEPKSKGFSFEQLRELRTEWGINQPELTSTKSASKP